MSMFRRVLTEVNEGMRRRFVRVAAATLAVGLAMAPTTAHANAPIDKRFWWFDSWHVQKEVWPVTKGAGVTVALSDSGVNASLPELKGAVLPGTNVRGGGENGLKDIGSEGHGTAMASLIAARGGGTGFLGIAPESKILPIVNPHVDAESSAAAIRYGVDNGAKVVSMSQGTSSQGLENGCPDELLDAIAYAAKKDVVLVAAAGNTGSNLNHPEYPASCPGVVAVGAFDNLANPWKDSQRHDYVTVAGPGERVVTLRADGRLYYSTGTSGAAALISGVFALVRSKYPDMTARQAVQLVTNTTVDIGPKGKDKQSGFGAVSIRRALKTKVPESAPNPVYERLDAALAKKDGKGASATPEAAAKDESSGAGPLMYVGIGAVVLALVGVLGFVLVRRRRPSPAPAGPPPGGPFFGEPGAQPPAGPQTGGQQPPPQFQPPAPPRND